MFRLFLLKYFEFVKFKIVVVVVDYKNCLECGVEILWDYYGNVVDVVIVIVLCVGVVNVYLVGIGGGGFMIIYDKKRGELL